MLEGNDRILSQSKSILKEYDLCDFCLGRFFINLSSFSSARRLGLKIRNSINSKNMMKASKGRQMQGFLRKLGMG